MEQNIYIQSNLDLPETLFNGSDKIFSFFRHSKFECFKIDSIFGIMDQIHYFLFNKDNFSVILWFFLLFATRYPCPCSLGGKKKYLKRITDLSVKFKNREKLTKN